MTRQEKIEKLVEAIFAKEYGETIPHWEIEQIIGENQKSTRYHSVVSSAKKKLVKVGKMVENVKGVGYRLVYPDEYTDQAVKLVTSGAKRIDKGSKVLQNAPVSDMTQSGLQAYNTTCDRMRILQAAVTGAKVELNLLNSKRKNPLELMQGGNV